MRLKNISPDRPNDRAKLHCDPPSLDQETLPHRAPPNQHDENFSASMIAQQTFGPVQSDHRRHMVKSHYVTLGELASIHAIFISIGFNRRYSRYCCSLPTIYLVLQHSPSLTKCVLETASDLECGELSAFSCAQNNSQTSYKRTTSSEFSTFSYM